MKNGYVYFLTNRPNGILYVGVTSDLIKRVYQHRAGAAAGFTKRYGLKRLVYFEVFDDIRSAIQREHNIKHWSRTCASFWRIIRNGTICMKHLSSFVSWMAGTSPAMTTLMR